MIPFVLGGIVSEREDKSYGCPSSFPCEIRNPFQKILLGLKDGVLAAGLLVVFVDEKYFYVILYKVIQKRFLRRS